MSGNLTWGRTVGRKYFAQVRLESKSFEPLIDFQAFLVQEL